MPDVPHPQEGLEEGRQQPDDALRLRRLLRQQLPTFRPDVPRGSSGAASGCGATCAAAASTARRGTRPGMLEKKQNVFDDFIAAAEYLVEREVHVAREARRSWADRTAGCWWARSMTQRPDLFARGAARGRRDGHAALPPVHRRRGVGDRVRLGRRTRTQFLPTRRTRRCTTSGPGTCYPATLITTADHDDRVVPSHSFKFAAALQAAQGCDKPILIRVETQGSHGYRPTDKRIAELADQWAFAARAMGMK